MDLATALLEVSKGNKVSCPVWTRDGDNYHVARGVKGEPVWWNGKEYEVVEAYCLAGWIRSDFYKDWYIVQVPEVKELKDESQA